MTTRSSFSRLALPAAVLLCCIPAHRATAGTSPSRSKASRTSGNTTKAPPKARCRDIFCMAHHVALDATGATDKNTLTAGTVRTLMVKQQPKIEPCVVNARRRDSHLKRVLIEFVVDAKGRVLATRVNGKRRSGLARCVHRHLRRVKFPPSRQRRTLASFELRIAH